MTRLEEIRAAVEAARAVVCVANEGIPSAVDMVLRNNGIAAQQYLLAEIDRLQKEVDRFQAYIDEWMEDR